MSCILPNNPARPGGQAGTPESSPPAACDDGDATRLSCSSPDGEAAERRRAARIREYWRRLGGEVEIEVVHLDGCGWGIRSNLTTELPPGAAHPDIACAPAHRRRG